MARFIISRRLPQSETIRKLIDSTTYHWYINKPPDYLRAILASMRLEATRTQPNIRIFSLRFRPPPRFIKALAIFVGLVAMGAGYHYSGTPITLRVNGQAHTVRMHRLSVRALVSQTGLSLRPEDRVWPPIDSGLTRNQPVEIFLARPVVVDFGEAGRFHPRTVFTHRQTPVDIYGEMGISLAASDDVTVNGLLWPHDAPIPAELPVLSPGIVNLKARLEAQRPVSVRLVLHPSVPIYIADGDTDIHTIYTTAETVGDVLVAQNIPLYLGDAITPELSEPLTPETTISIERATPFSIVVDGAEIDTRSRRPTVGEALAQEQVALVGQDYVIPAADQPIEMDMEIRVVRVSEVLEIEKETTDFETIWVPDDNLELDIQQVQQVGQEGVTKTRTRVRYEDGQAVSQLEEDTWLEQEPADKVIAYGTNVVVRTLDTPGGPIEYWRRVRMLATSYSAATSGKSKDHPAYGITRTGVPAGRGVVAVDPSVILLRSNVYVPGYGRAFAGDTGGAILGKHIDLGFDEDVPPLWYKWVDVYLLTPAPPWHDIRFVLPQWPQER